MMKDSPIVRDTRRVRCAISKRFGHDPDKYIDDLLKKVPKGRRTSTGSSVAARHKRGKAVKHLSPA